MVQKVAAYKTHDNQLFPSITEAQEHELRLNLTSILEKLMDSGTEEEPITTDMVVSLLMANRSSLVGMLASSSLEEPCRR